MFAWWTVCCTVCCMCNGTHKMFWADGPEVTWAFFNKVLNQSTDPRIYILHREGCSQSVMPNKNVHYTVGA